MDARLLGLMESMIEEGVGQGMGMAVEHALIPRMYSIKYIV